MVIAQLIDNIWATRKSEKMNGLKLMIAQLEDESESSRLLVVADNISAGIGDRVLIAQGSAARRMFEDDKLPIDAAVVAIIDEKLA